MSTATQNVTASANFSASAAETILARLRRETRASHERAESLLGLPASFESHRRALERFYGFLKPWEASLTPALARYSHVMQGREKTPLLETDLIALGRTPEQISRLPVCDHLPTLDTPFRVLGSAYVFEGATLGGTVLSRHVESTLGFSNGVGYSFYRSYGPNVGAMWRAFGEALTAASVDAAGSRNGEIVAGAIETFDRFCDWLRHTAA